MTTKTFGEACKLRDQKQEKRDRIFGILHGIGNPIAVTKRFWSRHPGWELGLIAEKVRLEKEIEVLNQAIYDYMRDNDSRIFVGY